MSKDDTYCHYFWSHVALFNGHTATPCCRYEHIKYVDGVRQPPFHKFTTFTEAIHSNKWKQMRTDSANGIKNPGCWKCYKEEANDITSLRQVANGFAADRKEHLELDFLEINLGNHCNLACNICCSENSSLWEKDEDALSKISNEFERPSEIQPIESQFSLEAKDYEHVNIIKFVGGEPMIHPKFLSLLDFIIEHDFAKNISLQVFTNSSWIPKSAIIDRISQFKKVTVSLSIDGVGVVNDYSRWPSKWETVDAAARTWIALSNNDDTFDVRWEPTISVYNATTIPEMIEWWIDTNIEVRNMSFIDALYHEEYDDTNLFINTVHWPTYLTGNLIPSSEYECTRIDKFIDRIDRQYGINRHTKRLRQLLLDVKNYISQEANQEHVDRFVKFTHAIDRIRDNNLGEINPTFWKLFS